MNPDQFGRYTVTKKNEKGRTIYNALVQDPNATVRRVNAGSDPSDRLSRALFGHHSPLKDEDYEEVPQPGYYGAAEVQVHHHRATGWTQYPDPYGWNGQNSDPEEASHEGYDETWAHRHARSAWGDDNDEIPGQLPMFEHRSTKPSSTLEYMATTRSARTMGMTLMGMAARDTLLEHGRELKPAEDLSEHSSRIVQKLADRGVTTAPVDEERNDMTFRDEPGYFTGRTVEAAAKLAGQPVDVHDVRKGQQFLKATLRSSRPPKQSSLDQPPLF